MLIETIEFEVKYLDYNGTMIKTLNKILTIKLMNRRISNKIEIYENRS